MERRTKLLILIVIALAILGVGIWFLLTPILGPSPEQPPSLPGNIQPSTSLPPVTGTNSGPATVPTSSGVVVPPQIKQLGDLAAIVVARIGSGTNSEGFRGYSDVLLNATLAYQQRLQQDRSAMQRLHPETGPAYEIITRVVSIDVSKASAGAQTNVFILQAQKAERTGSSTESPKVSYIEASVTFVKQADGSYLVDNIVWKDIVP